MRLDFVCNMFSSLGFDAIKPHKSMRNDFPTKYFELPRGFSVQVFKSAGQSVPAPQNVGGKVDAASFRPLPPRKTSPPNFERKPSQTGAVTYRPVLPVNEPPLEPKRSKPKPYGIYPTVTNDMFIYERSFTSASDDSSSSPSSSSSDFEFHSEPTDFAYLEVSSTRASSSTETLETTALSVYHPASVTRPPLPRSASSSDWARVTPDGSRVLPPGLPSASRSETTNFEPPSVTSRLVSTAAIPADTLLENESDSDTCVGDEADIGTALTVRNPEAREDAMRRTYATPLLSQAARRYSDERISSTRNITRKRIPADEQNVPTTSPAQQYRQNVPSGSRPTPALPLLPRAGDNAEASPHFPPQVATPARALPVTPGVARSLSMQRTASGADYHDAFSSSAVTDGRTSNVAVSSSLPSAMPSTTNDNVPHASALAKSPSEGALVVATKRCVRWTEDLMCQCPLPRSERRTGWFNRRGDQLWTNAGRFKPPEAGLEYPPDLIGYPEPHTGWMNEEGVRIDMEHRLIPKPPIRSALKRPKTNVESQPVMQ